MACDGHAEYVPLAERIAAEVAAFRLATHAAELPADVMGLIAADLTDSELREYVRRTFFELPAVDKAAVLSSAYPSDMLLQVRLMEERERVRARGQLTSNIAELKHDAELYSKVSLGRIAQGAVVELYLYDEDDYIESGRSTDRLREEFTYGRLIRTTSLGDGRLHLLEDILGDATDGDELSPGFEDHEIIEIGTALYDRRHNSSTFVPYIYKATSVYANRGSSYDELGVLTDEDYVPLIAGALTINDEDIF